MIILIDENILKYWWCSGNFRYYQKDELFDPHQNVGHGLIFDLINIKTWKFWTSLKIIKEVYLKIINFKKK